MFLAVELLLNQLLRSLILGILIVILLGTMWQITLKKACV